MGGLASGSEPVIAITGANGFVGRACVAEARRQNLPVIAVYRSAPLPEWASDANITELQLDLCDETAAQALKNALPDHSAMIHAAAHLGDDIDRLVQDTMQSTRSVMNALRGRDIRMVLISSLAVYDTEAVQPGDTITEASPLIEMPDQALESPREFVASARDPYAGAKRLQEAMLTHDDDAEDDWVLRPGAIWGPGRSWHALQGFWASKLHITIGSTGQLPLAHVEHVARAAVEAARTPTEGVPILNVFDDDLPTRAQFLAMHKASYGWPRANLTVPYGLWLTLIRLMRPLADKLPGLFREPILRARMMPLRYPNTRLRQALQGNDKGTFSEMMKQTWEAEQ
ncbi:NAD-dependent epimerase/dehydratase family protein [Thalassococcus lentus]|uniref:NAD-dependent epimerase/dehydratase family protein n=1 Tax=Thalassococcus lentus TaxID=1210524 RepID=A0ABT4XNH6_9RHOB|nr:NAD-dependent epimerase/dehydratase family protein [Thalassococcus lentus]MDA7423504.1 NAD-dependent epimerase/dehydratase family protein [Thalassococcus lentus]